MELVVSAKSRITSVGVFLDDEELLLNEGDSFEQYMKACYSYLELSYPKFFKMDLLSKLCFIGSEVLLKGQERMKNYDRDKVAVMLQNYHSSIYSDKKHYDSIKDKQNYFPSPAVFVYTLPNIMIGEICIRNRILGEGSCFLSSNENSSYLRDYVRILFEEEGYLGCIAGSVDYTDEMYLAELNLVEKMELVDKHIATFESIF